MPPQITTYHCICSQLLLATPYPLSTLPRRAPPSLDGARILPLGRPPTSHITSADLPVSSENEKLGLTEESVDGGSGTQEPEVRYSLLLNTTLDKRPVMVRREDGYEKRWVRRCGRCRTGVGYVLGSADVGSGVGAEREGGVAGGGVVYLLEEGLVETEVLKAGGAPTVEG